MTFDQQIRHVLERALTDLRGHLEADLGRFAQDLMRVAGEERRRATIAAAEDAAAEVRRQADAQIFELRRGFEHQLEEIRRTAQKQLKEAPRATQSHLDDVRRQMTAELEETRRQLEAQVEEAWRLARDEIEQARAELEAAKRATQEEAEEVASAELAVVRAEVERVTAEAAERARVDGYQAEVAASVRLVDAIRALDEAGSLGSVLDCLTERAAREAERAAVMIVRGERLRGWRFSGFEDAGPPTSVDLDLDAAGLPGVVVRTGSAVSRFIPDTDQEKDTRQARLPPFAVGAGARHATAAPVLVAGHVVGVVYADAPQLDAPPATSRWPAVIEVLARHASRVLEAMTVERATGFSLAR